MLSRRNFIKNAAGILVAAPMVVKAESLMGVNKSLITPTLPRYARIKREEFNDLFHVDFDPARPGDDVLWHEGSWKDITIEIHCDGGPLKGGHVIDDWADDEINL